MTKNNLLHLIFKPLQDFSQTLYTTVLLANYEDFQEKEQVLRLYESVIILNNSQRIVWVSSPFGRLLSICPHYRTLYQQSTIVQNGINETLEDKPVQTCLSSFEKCPPFLPCPLVSPPVGHCLLSFSIRSPSTYKRWSRSTHTPPGNFSSATVCLCPSVMTNVLWETLNRQSRWKSILPCHFQTPDCLRGDPSNDHSPINDKLGLEKPPRGEYRSAFQKPLGLP